MADAGFRGVAFFIADNHHRAAPKAAQTADDGVIVGKCAVPREGREIVDQGIDVGHRVRTALMAGDLRLLPRRQLGIGLR